MPKHGRYWKNKDLHKWMEGIEDSIALSPQFYGAEADGTTDDTTAINDWLAGSGLKFVPNGDYLASGSVTAFTRPTLILADNAKESGTYLPFISITDGAVNFKDTPRTLFFLYQNTTNRSDERGLDIRRVVNTDDGHTNPSALYVETTKNNSNDSTEWVFSAVLNNYSNTAANGDTAVSGTSRKYGTASTFAGHFHVLEMFKTTAATDVTGLIGAEINTTAVGLDHPTANGNLGSRRGLDIIARTSTGVSGWDTATDNYGDGEIGVGLHIRGDDSTRSKGYFRNAIVISQGTGNTNNGARSIFITRNVTGQQIEVSGNASYGLVLSGAYSAAAIRIPTQSYIAMEATDTVKTAWNITAALWGFYHGSTERFAINMTTGALRVNGLEVIGPRNTGWAADTGTAKKTANATYSGTASAGYVQAEMQAIMNAVRDATQTIKALKDAGITHGWIGT